MVGTRSAEPVSMPDVRCTFHPACACSLDHVNASELPGILQAERQTRRDEVAIDLEDRQTKKGTPPRPTEEGDIRELRRAGGGGGSNNGISRPAPMVE